MTLRKSANSRNKRKKLNQREKEEYNNRTWKALIHVVCYTAVFSVVTQRSSWGGALRDDTKNGCVADYDTCWYNWFESIISDLLNAEPNYRCLYHRIHLYWINLHSTPSSFFYREKCLTWSKCWKQHLTFLIFKNTCRKKMNENADEPKEIFHMKYVHLAYWK